MSGTAYLSIQECWQIVVYEQKKQKKQHLEEEIRQQIKGEKDESEKNFISSKNNNLITHNTVFLLMLTCWKEIQILNRCWGLWDGRWCWTYTDWWKVAQTHLLVLGAHLCSQLIQTSAEGLLVVALPGPVQADSQLKICGCRHWWWPGTSLETEPRAEF